MKANRNLTLQWMHKVLEYKPMHASFPSTLKIATLVDSILERRELSNCIFADPDDTQVLINTLTWRFGIPNTEYFIFSPNRWYIDKTNPFLHGWKNVDPDEAIIQLYLNRPNTEYPQPDTIPDLPAEYNMFIMQDPIGMEYNHIVDAVAYARENKVYTVFRKHPLAKTKIDIFDSEYTIAIEAGYNLNHLVANATKVFSSWSSVSLNAMLAGKPCATYDTMPFSEIVPTISAARELETIEAVSRDTLSRFLSWHDKKLCINIGDADYAERIEQRIVDFSQGLDVLR